MNKKPIETKPLFNENDNIPTIMDKVAGKTLIKVNKSDKGDFLTVITNIGYKGGKAKTIDYNHFGLGEEFQIHKTRENVGMFVVKLKANGYREATPEELKQIEEFVKKNGEEENGQTRFREDDKDQNKETIESTINELENIITKRNYEVMELNEAEKNDVEKVNDDFNLRLGSLSEESANKIIFSLGKPSSILRYAGIHDIPMKLYGNKVIKKMKKHGFTLEELKDLPKNLAEPIAVFNNKQKEGNRAILTELKTAKGNVLVVIDLGKGEDVDVNIVSSIFGKSDNSIYGWLKKGYDTYLNKEKALNYLHYPAPIAETLRGSRLISESKDNNNFRENKENIEKKTNKSPFRTDEGLEQGVQQINEEEISEHIDNLQKRFKNKVTMVNSLDEVTGEKKKKKIEQDQKNGTKKTKG